MIPMKAIFSAALVGCFGTEMASPAFAVYGDEQADPRRLRVTTEDTQGSTFWVKLSYQLPGGPDSALTSVQQGSTVLANHRLPPVTRDSFALPKPAVGSSYVGQGCVQSKRRGLLSNQVCAGFSFTASDTPPPPPIIDSVIADTAEMPLPSAPLWEDRFLNGVRAPDRNGIGWRGLSAGSGDAIIMANGKMVFRCAGGVPDDDCWVEANLVVGVRSRLCVAATWKTNAEYAHRSVSPGNNKLLRMFGGPQGSTRDQALQVGRLNVGMSVNPGSDGSSNLIGEYKKPEGMGPYGLGPNTRVLLKGANQIRLMQCSSVGTSANTGYSQIWFNGVSIYEHRNLPLWVSGEFNQFQYVYLPGWANSGYAVQTDLELLHVAIDTVPIPAYTTP